jgi:biopolymer transport protein ExbB
MESISSTNFLINIFDDILILLTLGGPVVVILIVASIFGLALALRKFMQFSKVGAPELNGLHVAVDQWQRGERKRAIEVFNNSSLPIAKDLHFALEQQTKIDSDFLYDEMLRRSSTFLREYSNNLRLLELIYSLAPVLGLLGTVLGMIDAFRGLADSAGTAGESSALAGGIWEALLTTAVGLSIAIFFAVIHALLESKLETLVDNVNDVVSRVLHLPEKT